MTASSQSFTRVRKATFELSTMMFVAPNVSGSSPFSPLNNIGNWDSMSANRRASSMTFCSST
ncbi:MAG: hypothetical protein ABIH23_10020, partial [bacterium]